MSGHLVDIVVFSPSAKYHEDPINTLAEAFRENKDHNASHDHTFHGRSHEDPSEAYLISTNSLPHTLKEVISSHLGSFDEHFSVNFKGDGIAAMHAPVTELAFITIKPGSSEDDIARYLDILTGQDTSTVVAATWGRTNVASTWVMVVGWQSKQAHEEVVNNPTPEFKNLIGNLRNLVDVKVMHAELVHV